MIDEEMVRRIVREELERALPFLREAPPPIPENEVMETFNKYRGKT
jgi:hypothetical protein